MRRLPLLLLAAFFVSCASSNYDRPQPSHDDEGDRAPRMGFDLLPPANWWHDPQVTASLTLTGDQVASLDRIGTEQGEEIAKLERDSMTATRDVRAAVEAPQANSADIVAAGQRLRGIRDSLFDRQVQMLASERVVLSVQQWQALEDALRARRASRSNRNDGNYPRGRGGRGGRGGRMPGWPG